MQSNRKADTPAKELRDLRITRGLTAPQMVAVVQRLYPKYDKPLQSKCEHGDEYGIDLRRDALDALKAEFTPGTEQIETETAGQNERTQDKLRRTENRRLPCRIYGRLSKTAYTELQQAIRADGYVTIQAWMENAVERYLAERRGRYG